MDERIISIFSIIADQVQQKQDLFTKESSILGALLHSGYPLVEADAALVLMQTMVQFRPERFGEAAPRQDETGIRTMTAEERVRFTHEAFGFAVKLARIGLISEEERDVLLDRAMQGRSGRIDMEHLKDLLAAELLMDGPDQDDPLLSLRRRAREQTWN